MIARQGMAIELGGVLFLFAGGLLAQQRWSLPFALYLCAWRCWRWFISACRHSGRARIRRIDRSACICHTHRIVHAPSRRPTPPLPPCRCRSRPPSPPPCCRWSRSSPASSCCPPGSRAWASMRPAPATSCPSSRWWRWRGVAAGAGPSRQRPRAGRRAAGLRGRPRLFHRGAVARAMACAAGGSPAAWTGIRPVDSAAQPPGHRT